MSERTNEIPSFLRRFCYLEGDISNQINETKELLSAIKKQREDIDELRKTRGLPSLAALSFDKTVENINNLFPKPFFILFEVRK